MDKKIESCCLIGQWHWTNTEVFYENRWQMLEPFESSDHIWNFREDNIMESEKSGRICYKLMYEWDKSKMTLLLNGYKLDRAGNKHALVYEKYNIIFLNPDEFYFYDTEEFIGIQGNGLRLNFRRASF